MRHLVFDADQKSLDINIQNIDYLELDLTHFKMYEIENMYVRCSLNTRIRFIGDGVGKWSLNIADMLVVVAKTILFDDNVSINATRCWFRADNIDISKGCKVNCITNWYQAHLFENYGELRQIGHCWMTGLSRAEPKNDSVFVNYGTVVAGLFSLQCI